MDADFDKAPKYSWIDRMVNHHESLLKPTYKLTVTVFKWCPCDKRLVLYLKSTAKEKVAFVSEPETGYDYQYPYEHTFNADGKMYCDFLLNETASLALGRVAIEGCSFEMVDTQECPKYGKYSLPCMDIDVFPVRQTIITNSSYTFADDDVDDDVSRRNFGDGFEDDFRDDFGGDNRSPYGPVGHGDVFDRQTTTEVEDLTALSYKRVDHCPFVEISENSFTETYVALIHVRTFLPIKKVNVEYTRNYDNNATIVKVKVCLADYLVWSRTDGVEMCANVSKQNNSHRDDDDDSFDTWTTVGLISIISSCISLMFLLLTLFTYFLFDEIRTRGCINIMLLTILLFISQALYEFAIEQYEDEKLCTIFGILIHYFWLATVFSMNSCTIERFVKLCFPLQSRSIFLSNKPIVISCLHTFLSPLVIVGINIVVNLAVRDDIGYGAPRICYINSRYSRIFSFVLPMCAIVLLNVGFLIFTIVKLRRRSALSGSNMTKSGSRIGLVACVRLSVATGVTWLISLLYEAIPEEALGYVFTAFLGLEGVIFFFSLLGNKKILHLYKTRFNFVETESTSSQYTLSKSKSTRPTQPRSKSYSK